MRAADRALNGVSFHISLHKFQLLHSGSLTSLMLPTQPLDAVVAQLHVEVRGRVRDGHQTCDILMQQLPNVDSVAPPLRFRPPTSDLKRYAG